MILDIKILVLVGHPLGSPLLCCGTADVLLFENLKPASFIIRVEEGGAVYHGHRVVSRITRDGPNNCDINPEIITTN